MTGSQFERIIVRALGDCGYWAHRIAPDARGAQPFDVIAMGGGKVIAADCKVCQGGRFSFERFEDNQRLAFELIRQNNMNSNNLYIGIFAWYDRKVYWIDYDSLLAQMRVGNKSFKVMEVGSECKLLSEEASL